MRHLLCLLLLFVLPRPALAGVDAVHGGPLVADGETSAVIHLHIPGVQPGDSVRVRSEEANVGAAAVEAPDRVVVAVAPRYRAEAGEITLAVRVRGAVTLDDVAKVPVVPPVQGELEVVVEPAELPMGKGTATIRVTAKGNEHLPATARAVRMAASVGTVGPVTRNLDGSWTATYTPPAKTAGPVSAVITAADATAPREVLGAAAVSLKQVARQTFSVEPGSMNLVVVDGKQLGPLPATADGKVTFELELHPAWSAIRLQSVLASGQRTDELVPVDVGAPPQVAFIPLDGALRVPAETTQRVPLLVTRPDGSGWNAAHLDGLAATGVGAPVLEDRGDGWYDLVVQVPRDPGPFTVNVTMGPTTTVLKAEAVAGAPQVTVFATPAQITADTKAIEVTARVKDSRGVALPKQALTVEVGGGRKVGALQDKGDGTYIQKLELNAGARLVDVAVAPAFQASSGTPARLLVWAGAQGVVAGTEAIPVWVVAEDAWGLPVANVAVTLGVVLGDGSLPVSVNTGKGGIGVARYQAGPKPGPVLLRAEVAGLVASSSLWQVNPAAPVAPGGLVGASVAAIEHWQGAAPVLVVREGAAPPAAVDSAAVAAAMGQATGGPTGAPVGGGGDAGAGSPGLLAGGGSARTGKLPPSSEDEKVRLRLGYAMVGQAWSMTAEDETAVPPVGNFRTGLAFGSFGAGLEAEAYFALDGRLGAVLAGQVGLYRPGEVPAAGDDEPTVLTDTLTDALVALSWRQPLGKLAVSGSLGYRFVDGVVFVYGDDTRTTVETSPLRANAAYLGAEGSVDAGPARIRLGAAGTAGLGVLAGGVRGGVDVNVTGPLLAFLSLDNTWRRLPFYVAGTPGGVLDRRTTLLMGAGAAF